MTRASTALARRVLAAVETQRDEMLEAVERLVRIETPTLEPAAQKKALAELAALVEGIGFRCRRIPGKRYGDQLLAVPARRRRGRAVQLLIGHCDTVWPLGTLAQMPFRDDGRCLHGPGIYDMKTGLVQAVFALRTMHALDIQPEVTPILFVNSDEELGSDDSFRTIVRLSRFVDRAFVMEPSLEPGGKLKTERKGVVQYRVVVRGRAAHAGLNPEEGVSAILEIAHMTRALFDLNDDRRGVSVNVGIISGGTRANVIAAESRATVDVRVPTREDAERIDAAIRGLRPRLPGASIEVEHVEGRDPMEQSPGSRRLWEAARRHAESLGFDLQHGPAGGGSDGNITSQYVPTLDGLGAVGGGAHADHEHVELDRIPERTALLALLLLEPPTGGAASGRGRSRP